MIAYMQSRLLRGLPRSQKFDEFYRGAEMTGRSSFIETYFPGLSDRIFFLCGVLMLGSEVWKQCLLTFVLGHGTYNWWYFPFQLCSIPMYVLLAYPWLRRESTRRMLLEFLMSYCLLGGVAVFADTSGLNYPLPSLTVHSWTWHILLLLIGLGAGIVYSRRLDADAKNIIFSRTLSHSLPLRPFFHATLLYLCCCLAAELFNLSLDRFGLINMFYINPHLQMQQVVFRDLVPIIGNLPAIPIYIAATCLGAFLFFLIWNLIFRLMLRK